VHLILAGNPVKAHINISFACDFQIPNYHFESLVSLVDTVMRINNVNWQTVFIAANAAYLSSTFYREAIFAISEYLRERVLASLGDSPYGIMIDESTDVSNRSQMVVYIRWYDLSIRRPREEYLGIVHLDAGDADTIFNKLVSFLRGEGLDLARMVCFGSDGASVMTGCMNGVGVRLQKLVPYLVCIHCCSHRFALAVSNASQQVPYIKNTYEPFLIALWSFLHFSPSRWSNLCAYYAMLKTQIPNLGLLLVIKKAIHTRWLSHINANTSLLSGLVTIIDWLLKGDYNSDSQAMGLRTVLNSFYFWRTLFALGDILPILTKCSVSLQSPSMDFTTASRKIKECVQDLKILHDDPMKGVWMASFRAFFDKWYSFFKPAWPKRLVARVARRHFDDEPEDPAGIAICLLIPA